MIRIGLIQFPGSNCERETALAVKRVGMEPVEFLWNESLEKLRNLDGYILIGGFPTKIAPAQELLPHLIL